MQEGAVHCSCVHECTTSDVSGQFIASNSQWIGCLATKKTDSNLAVGM